MSEQQVQELTTSTMERWAPELPWGLCALVAADEIEANGGEPRCGWLHMKGGGYRSHWWVERDGEVIDPMADAIPSAVEGRTLHPNAALWFDGFIPIVAFIIRRESTWTDAERVELREITRDCLSGNGAEPGYGPPASAAKGKF